MPDVCYQRFKVAGLTSDGCFCGNWVDDIFASECLNTPHSGDPKNVPESKTQRWGSLLLFSLIQSWNRGFSFMFGSIDGWWLKYFLFFTLNHQMLFTFFLFFFSCPVLFLYLLEVEMEVWLSTELKDHFCTESVSLSLQTECRLGKLLWWKCQGGWQDAPINPQVRLYFVLTKENVLRIIYCATFFCMKEWTFLT